MVGSNGTTSERAVAAATPRFLERVEWTHFEERILRAVLTVIRVRTRELQRVA